ncbi:hypothetical protein PV11_00486 [Exophiala sideris]|uniref:Uncharacterized protein n=1 Tax=Exophiala sideris TaxID=1016849 RepID=A0A0D1W7L6_9EURO|nr:hypothetical protein PV11_00486 [Exophiala sideris]
MPSAPKREPPSNTGCMNLDEMESGEEEIENAMEQALVPSKSAVVEWPGDVSLYRLRNRTIMEDIRVRSHAEATSTQMPTNNDYTVGWACALQEEYIAAQLFLDEKHGKPQALAANDTNAYTLGCMGQHNVVITVFPAGDSGTACAAAVVTHMVHSFPNVKIGLMVGIGGGAPTADRDIRLGDIVVSWPKDGHAGVFQYDFGKTIQNQSFKQEKFLNQPPPALRSAIQDLQAEHRVTPHQLDKAIQEVLRRNPRLQKEFCRPKLTCDRLYRSEVVHPEGQTSCAGCGGNLETRDERTEDEDNPAVHYGLIASANQVMKDARIRDKLAAQKGVLCFEMEAAGLMNTFPCLVVRGISDYADSHKNDTWKGYAAMAATAYVKDLLRSMTFSCVKAEKPIQEGLKELSETVTGMKSEVNELTRRQHEQLHRDVLDWLLVINCAPQHDQLKKHRNDNCGQWLLNDPEFLNWKACMNHTLDCKGIEGAGKTFATSMVIDHLEGSYGNSGAVGIAYLYFNSKEQWGVNESLSDLLSQLAVDASTIDIVKTLHGKHQWKRTRPMQGELLEALKSVIAVYSRTFIILDALDEIAELCRETLLSKLVDLQRTTKLNLFTTSRLHIRTEILYLGTAAVVSLDIVPTDEDIRRYLLDRTKDLPTFVRRDPKLQEDIIDTIARYAEAIFLLARLNFETLLDETSKRNVRDSLQRLEKRSKSMPSEHSNSEVLAMAYTQTIKRLENQHPNRHKLARQTLSWILYSKRALTASELQTALAIRDNDSSFDPTGISDIDIIIESCKGLLISSANSRGVTVRFMHSTAQEYFMGQGNEVIHPEAYLAFTCITHLTFDVFKDPCYDEASMDERHSRYPLYQYAAGNWGRHAEQISEDASDPIMKFLECAPKVRSAWQSSEVSFKSPAGHDWAAEGNPLYAVAPFNLPKIVEMLNARGYNTPCEDEGRRPWDGNMSRRVADQLLQGMRALSASGIQAAHEE